MHISKENFDKLKTANENFGEFLLQLFIIVFIPGTSKIAFSSYIK